MQRRFVTAMAAGITGISIAGYLTLFKNPTARNLSLHSRVSNEYFSQSQKEVPPTLLLLKKQIPQKTYMHPEEVNPQQELIARESSFPAEAQYTPETTPQNQEEEPQASCIVISPDASSLIQSGYWPSPDTLLDSLAKKEGIADVLNTIENKIGTFSDTQKKILHEDASRIVARFSEETGTLEDALLAGIENYPFSERRRRAQEFMRRRGQVASDLYGEIKTCLQNNCTWWQWKECEALSRNTSLFF